MVRYIQKRVISEISIKLTIILRRLDRIFDVLWKGQTPRIFGKSARRFALKEQGPHGIGTTCDAMPEKTGFVSHC